MLGVKTANRVVHDKIRRTDQGEYVLLPSMGSAVDQNQPVFATVPALVDHYLVNGNAAGLGYTLVDSNPIYDNHQLIQERTGAAVKHDTSNMPLVPEKQQGKHDYAEGRPSVLSTTTFRQASSTHDKSDGYLDIADTPDV